MYWGDRLQHQSSNTSEGLYRLCGSGEKVWGEAAKYCSPKPWNRFELNEPKTVPRWQRCSRVSYLGYSAICSLEWPQKIKKILRVIIVSLPFCTDEKCSTTQHADTCNLYCQIKQDRNKLRLQAAVVEKLQQLRTDTSTSYSHSCSQNWFSGSFY